MGDWMPGDPLPPDWDLPAACPAGHLWGPGWVHSSWISYEEGFIVRCYRPNSPLRECPWTWGGMGKPDGNWGRRQMSGRWNPSDGTLLPPNSPADTEVFVDGQWRRGGLHAWLPVPGDGWEADVYVYMSEEGPPVRMRVKPDRVRRASWQTPARASSSMRESGGGSPRH